MPVSAIVLALTGAILMMAVSTIVEARFRPVVAGVAAGLVFLAILIIGLFYTEKNKDEFKDPPVVKEMEMTYWT